MLNLILMSLLTYLPVLVSIAFVILGERKLLAAIQRREGPNLVGWFGLLQSFVDGFKLILKENILPHKSNKILFFISAFNIFLVSLITWILVPTGFYHEIIDTDFTVFIVFIFSLINVYCIILAGWASNSKYSFIGSLRSTAQMISYEVYFGLIILPIFFFSESTNLNDIIYIQKNVWFVFLYYPLFVLFFITNLAETNRSPFDLPEAEAEIVAGYNVEYAGLIFSFFFLAEYNNIFLSCSYTVIFFFGGFLLCGFANSLIFFIKVIFFVSIFIFIRGMLPRYRYDQLMVIGWKKFLPLILGFVLFYSSYINFLNIFV